MDSTSSTVNNASYREKNGAQSVGISIIEKPSVFTVYPNPTIGNFNVIIGGLPDNDYSISVYDIVGNKIADKKSKLFMNTASAVSFNELNVQAGNYLITLETMNGKLLQTQKVTVVK